METDYNKKKKMILDYHDEDGNRIHEDKISMVIDEVLANIDYKETDYIKKAFERALVNLGYKKQGRRNS